MITKIENIPPELHNLPQWTCWQLSNKVPRNPHNGNNAKSNDPSTWGTLAEAVDACGRYGFDGVGFEFANGYFGVDLDHVLDDTDICTEFVETLGSYAEISRSGDGLHIICRGTLPDGARRKDNVEMYSEGRYFICTGNIYNNKYKDIVDCTETVKVLHSKYLYTPQVQQSAHYVEPLGLDDSEVVEMARSCRNGGTFWDLYNGNWQGIYSSQSEADQALCNHLAFWTQRNEAQMDRIFRSSGLMRGKWDSKRGADTYGNITIGKACAGCVDVYEPRKMIDSTEVALSLFGDTPQVATKRYEQTDTGNAQRLYDKYGDRIHYSYNRKKWYFWDGKMWALDDVGGMKKLVDTVIDDMKREAFLEDDDDTQEAALKWVTKTASSKNKENMIKECQHLGNVPVQPNAFDVYSNYINTMDGIVSLETGELIPHDPRFMFSRMCTCGYDRTGEPPKLWLKFLDDITGGDKELQAYIQRCIGYSLSGSNSEQCAFFLYGMGNNGKSTFLGVINEILGGYSATVQADTITVKNRMGGNGTNSDIARLKGVRFASSEEPDEGVRLNEGLLKQLTGGSKVTCRFLYGEEFEYTPEFKIWMATNHKPIVRGTDFGIWRRIKLIPFEAIIPKDKIDKNLPYKLRAEYPQILRWAVEGCIAWQKAGDLGEPKVVKSAVADYKQEMDLLAGFIDCCVEIDYNCNDRIQASEIFKTYSKWAKENNEYEMSSKKFFNELAKKMPSRGRNAKGAFYTNIRWTEYALELRGGTMKQYNFDDFKEG